MSNILIIDDERTFLINGGEYGIHVRTVKEAREWLRAFAWDEVWFDHDMGGNSTTQVLANEMEREPHKYDIGAIYIHSMNPNGARRLYWTLQEHFSTQLYDI